MSENKEVTASDVIDVFLEHFEDSKNLRQADIGYAFKQYKQYRDESYERLQQKLDTYIDQRIKKMLVESNLIKVVDPMD
jgi:hypothetical protein